LFKPNSKSLFGGGDVVAAVLEPQESVVQQPENFNVTEQRETLFRVLRHVLAVSLEKVANSGKQGWGRLIVNTIQTYGKLLETAEIENLVERVTALEQQREER
jgi:hypothetical protein